MLRKNKFATATIIGALAAAFTLVAPINPAQAATLPLTGSPAKTITVASGGTFDFGIYELWGIDPAGSYTLQPGDAAFEGANILSVDVCKIGTTIVSSVTFAYTTPSPLGAGTTYPSNYLTATIRSGVYTEGTTGGPVVCNIQGEGVNANGALTGHTYYLTLNINISKPTYPVTFDPNGGTFGLRPDSVTTDVTLGEIASVPNPAPTNPGYTLFGWNTKDNAAASKVATLNSWLEDTKIAAPGATFYAVWTKAVPVDVTFDCKGGDVASCPASPQSVLPGDHVTDPGKPTLAGNTFAGWFAEPSTTAWDFTNDVVASAMTLTAHWTPEVSAYTVTLDPGLHGTLSGSATGSIDASGKIVVPADPTPTGDFQFLYWAENGTEWNFDTVVDHNVTLTAIYEAIPASAVQVKVSYSAPAICDKCDTTITGDVPSKPQSVTTGMPFKTPKLSATGYSLSWVILDSSKHNQKVLATYVPDSHGKITIPSTDQGFFTTKTDHGKAILSVTLVAKWSAVPVQVKFDANAPTGVQAKGMPSSIKAKFCDSIKVKGTPKADGFTFMGWNTAADGSGTAYAPGDKILVNVYSTDKKGNNSLTLYAQWAAGNVTPPPATPDDNTPAPNSPVQPGTPAPPIVPAPTGGSMAGSAATAGIVGMLMLVAAGGVFMVSRRRLAIH